MEAVSRRAWVFWLVVVSSGFAAVLASLIEGARLVQRDDGGPAMTAWLLVLAGTLAQSYRVPIPNPRLPLGAFIAARYETGSPDRRTGAAGGVPAARETLSLVGAVHAFALLALWPAPAICVAALAAVLARPAGRGWWRQAFNVSQTSLSVGAGACVWQAGQSWGTEAGPLALGAGLSLLVYVAVGSATVVGMAAAVERLSFAHVWRRGRRPILVLHLLLITAGALFWWLWRGPGLLPGGLVVTFALAMLYHSLRSAVLLRQQTCDALSSMADLLEERDRYTHQHSLRVAHLAEQLAVRLDQSCEDAGLIFLCARLHDIGKCTIPNEVLLKPGALDPDQRALMARHAALGARMLQHFPEFRVGASYVRAHHEWYDGRGYPDGLARSEIPLGARIIAVADAYDAMTSDRPYREALPHAEVVRRLLAGAGTQWDPRIVLTFLELLGEPASVASKSPSGIRRTFLTQGASTAPI